MGDYFSMSIDIGGKLDRSLLPELVVAIPQCDEGPATIEEFEALKPGDDVHIMVGEGRWDDYQALTVFCQEHDLAYRYHCDPKYEYDGELEVWLPGWDAQRTWTANADGQAHFTAEEIIEKLKRGPRKYNRMQFIADLELTLTELPPFELVGEVPPVEAPDSELREFTVIAIYADDDTRYAEMVLAADPEAAEAMVRQYATHELIIAGVIAGHITLVG